MLDAAVKHLCATNFLVFQKVELDFEIGPQHKIWWDDLRSGKDVCEMAPRDHGKSHSIVRAYALWRIKYFPWIREVLILGADQTAAVENMDKIKEMANASPYLVDLLPKNRSEGTNSRTEVRFLNGKKITAKGIGSPLRGRHPQLIILDDVVNEANSFSSEDRQKLIKYVNEVVLPMKDKGTIKQRTAGLRSQIVIVGTAQDYEDLYHTLQKNPQYEGVKLKAIMDEETQTVLWPDRYSYEDLMAVKESIGSLSFAKEYQNDPMSDDTTIFPTSLFQPLFDTTLEYVRNYEGADPVYMGVDFSVPGSTDGDWTVIFVMSYNAQDNLFTPLNYWRAKPTDIKDQLSQIEYFAKMYKVTMGYLEDNMFQAVYREHFKRHSTLPLRGHTVTAVGKKSMKTGLISIRPILENAQICFPYKTEADRNKTDMIVSEFNGVKQRNGKIGNESSHDDIVLAMWHAICASRTTSFEFDFGT